MAPQARPAIDRLMSKVVWNGDEDECWTWEGARDKESYGVFRNDHQRMGFTHRFSYEHFVGRIPPGLVLDHLCRVHGCVNPAHLEPVTTRENVRRGEVAARARDRQLAKTHCPQGHPYSGENLFYRTGETGRRCRACKKTQDRAAHLRRKARLKPPIG